jgi:N-acetylmuramoyl-L-alanine amidase
VLDTEVYLIVGDHRAARDAVYELHNALAEEDMLPPWGWTDAPTKDQIVKNTVTVSGWAFDNTSVESVQVFVDGQLAGNANYGHARPDVAASAYAHAPTNIGFSYNLDTRNYSNGNHTVVVKASDNRGNTAVFNSIRVKVQN